MERINTDLDGLKIVNGDDLKLWTDQGWKPLMMVERVGVEQHEVTRPCPGGTTNTSCIHGMYGPCSLSVDVFESYPVRIPQVLIGQDPTSYAAQQAATIADLVEERDFLLNEKAQLQTRCDDLRLEAAKIPEMERHVEQAQGAEQSAIADARRHEAARLEAEASRNRLLNEVRCLTEARIDGARALARQGEELNSLQLMVLLNDAQVFGSSPEELAEGYSHLVNAGTLVCVRSPTKGEPPMYRVHNYDNFVAAIAAVEAVSRLAGDTDDK